jgi:acyl-CoA thioesterase
MSESVNKASAASAPVLPERPTLDELEAYLSGDNFATKQAKCKILEGWAGHGKCEMTLDPAIHCNAQNAVMGGAIFTLADYAFACATVPGSAGSVTLSSTIEFIKQTRGHKLIATCDADKSGRRVGFYTTCVIDDAGELIAKITSTSYHLG